LAPGFFDRRAQTTPGLAGEGKMAISRTAGIGLTLCALLGTAAAGYGGWMFASRFLLNNWVQEQAGDVKDYVGALRMLRAGKTADAIELLETRLDDDLIVLVPEGQPLRPPVRAQMVAALGAAKQYRTEHPRTSRRPSIDAMVRNVLSREYSAAAE
jgi:hypothetical protein